MKKNYQVLTRQLRLGHFKMLKLAICLSFLLLAVNGRSQCSTTFTPATSCSSADQIQTFTLNGIAAIGNGGCSPNAYGLFTNPVWNLIIGNTYTWTITNGPTWTQGVAIWIDLNNDGFLTANEQLANDPAALMHTGTLTIPFSATGANNVRMRLRCQYNTTLSNTNSTACDSWTFGETEDYLVNLIPPTPCNNTPVANSLLSPTYAVCPGSNVPITLANSYTVGNLTYTWSAASQSVGPFVAIPNANSPVYTATNATVPMWYQLSVTCPGFGLTTLVGPGQVQVATTTTNSVPYYEGFENPVKSGVNELPNCSWTRSNPGNCKTSTITAFSNRMPNTGIGFANFDYNQQYSNSTYNFYSNGIQLNAGVTYSAWVHYITPGWNAYSNFNLKYGPNQNQTGMVTLGTVASPNNNTYKLLSNTFQVATSGIYYLNIQATDNSSGDYFTFDDLGIIAPCTFTNNAANMTINGPAAICVGQTVNITATGAGAYSWNNGLTNSSIQVSPLNDAVYTVVGTNTLSNCTTTLSTSMIVNPLPGVQIYAPKATICEGETAVLFASGSASSFTWSNGPNTPLNSVQPAAPGVFTYSVIGANSYGCQTISTQVINVNPLPTVNVTGNLNICKGEPGTMTGNGANSYTWTSQTAYLQANPVSPYPMISTVYTVTGTDANGCEGQAVVNMVVNACTGIANVAGALEGLQVYPNPNNGEFTVELNNGLSKTIEVFDITGRNIVSSTSSSNEIKMNIGTLSNGVYYVKVKSDNAVEVVKIVKQ